MAIGGVSPERVAIPELGVAPLVDADTDLEDKLPTPEDSMLLSGSSPEGVRHPRVRPAPPDLADLELEKALLSVLISEASARYMCSHNCVIYKLINHTSKCDNKNTKQIDNPYTCTHCVHSHDC